MYKGSNKKQDPTKNSNSIKIVNVKNINEQKQPNQINSNNSLNLIQSKSKVNQTQANYPTKYQKIIQPENSQNNTQIKQNGIIGIFTTTKTKMQEYFQQLLKKVMSGYQSRYKQLDNLHKDLRVKYLDQSLQTQFYTDLVNDRNKQIQQLQQKIQKIQKKHNTLKAELKDQQILKLDLQIKNLQKDNTNNLLKKEIQSKKQIIKQKQLNIKSINQEMSQKQKQFKKKIDQIINFYTQKEKQIKEQKDRQIKQNQNIFNSKIIIFDKEKVQLQKKQKSLSQKYKFDKERINQLQKENQIQTQKRFQAQSDHKRLKQLYEKSNNFLIQWLVYFTEKDFDQKKQFFSLQSIVQQDLQKYQLKEDSLTTTSIGIADTFANLKCQSLMKNIFKTLRLQNKNNKSIKQIQALQNEIIQSINKGEKYQLISNKLISILDKYLKIQFQDEANIKLFQIPLKVELKLKNLNIEIQNLQSLIQSNHSQHDNKTKQRVNKIISLQKELQKQKEFYIDQINTLNYNLSKKQDEYKKSLLDLQKQLDNANESIQYLQSNSKQEIKDLDLKKNQELQTLKQKYFKQIQDIKQRSKKNIKVLNDTIKENEIKLKQIPKFEQKIYQLEFQIAKLRSESDEKGSLMKTINQQKEKTISDTTRRLQQQISKKQQQIRKIERQKQFLQEKVDELQRNNNTYKKQLQEYKMKYTQIKQNSQKEQQYLLTKIQNNLNQKIKGAQFQFSSVSKITEKINQGINKSNQQMNLIISEIVNPDDKLFILKQVQEFTNKKIAGSELLFKWDSKFNTDFCKVMKQLKTFIIILKSENNYKYGFYIDKIADQSSKNTEAFLFSISKQQCFYRNKNASQQMKNCWFAFGGLVVYFGNKQIRLKNKDNIIKCSYGGMGSKCFNVRERLQLIGTDKDEIVFNEMQIHTFSLKQRVI